MKPWLLVFSLIQSTAWGVDALSAPQAELLSAPRTATTTTHLLFPFATTLAGTDTEILISNTSEDTLGTVPRSGACTLEYYGAGTASPSTTAPIGAGKMLAVRLSRGGFGIAARPDFEGYVAATCDFPLGRGTARVYRNGQLESSIDAEIVTEPRRAIGTEYLLFPYVTNRRGLDTRISLMNLSADPTGSFPAAGACSLHLYGANAPAAPVVTPQMVPGMGYTIDLSQVAPGFDGYALATCRFTRAAGLATLSDPQAPKRTFAERAEPLPVSGDSHAAGLLFPWTSTRNGLDSTLAIANTGASPFNTSNTSADSGTCQLSFYGTNAPSAISTESIAAGAVFSTSLARFAPDFEGYVFAACGFPDAHGWAFTSSSDGSVRHSGASERVSAARSLTPSSLLFTAASNRDGADTEVIIANTSRDALGTPNSAGRCFLSYFGEMDGGGALPLPAHSESIAAGEQLSFSISKGNPRHGIPAAPGFQGYLIADCEFPLARGSAIALRQTRLSGSGRGTRVGTPRAAGTISVSSAIVGKDLQSVITITFSPVPSTDTSVTITSSDPTLVILGSSGLAGSGQITTTVTANTTSIATYAQALSGSGTVTITAAAGGYASGSGTVTLANSGFVLAGPNGIGASFITYPGQPTTLTVYPSRLTTAGVFAEAQQVRGGFSVNLPISSTNTAVGSVSTPVAFSGGVDQVTTPFTALALGTTRVSLGAPPPLPSLGYFVDVTVDQSAFVPFNVTVGKNLQAPATIGISGKALTGPITVTLQSQDSTKLKFATSPTGSPSGTITVTIPVNQSTSNEFYVQGFDSTGTVGYTATASNLGTLNSTVALAPSGLVIQSPGGFGSDFTMSLGLVNATLNIWPARLTPTVEYQAVAADQSISAAVASDTPSVGTITVSPVTIAGGANYAATEFHPVGNGSATISATAAGYTSASVRATVQPPTVVLDGGFAIGNHLQHQATVILPVAAPTGGVDVTLHSTSVSLAISSSPTTAGSATLTLHIAGGGQFATYYLQALGSSGTVSYTGSAPGYLQGTATVDLAQSAVVITGPTSAPLSGGPATLQVFTGYLDLAGNPIDSQPLAGGPPLVVSLQNSTPATGTVPNTVTFAPNVSATTATFTPVALGTTTVSVVQPSGWNTPTSLSSVSIAVTSSSAALSISKTHTGNFAQGQAGAQYSILVSNSAFAAATSGTVTVTDTVPTGMTLVSMTGTGWTCGSGSCSRSEALAPGNSYPAITVNVNVAVNAGSPLVNRAEVSGGGAPTANTSDSTVIVPATVVTVTTNPAGLSIVVDGVTLTAPQSFSWTSGSTHTVNVVSPQTSNGTQYLFTSWSDSGAQSHTITTPASATTYTATFRAQALPQKIGVYRGGQWYLDVAGSGTIDSRTESFALGFPGATIVTGDWNGDGRTKVGVYNNGYWFLDYDGNGVWDGGVKDKLVAWGWAGATPIVGDWNGDGKTKIGVYSNGFWFLDYNGDYLWDGGVVDKQVGWGWAGVTPIVGDWNGDGKTKIGVYVNGFWFLDYDGNYVWDGGVVDKQVGWGWAGVTPIVGDWNGDGKTKIGVYAGGYWYIDYDGNYLWEYPAKDKIWSMGWTGTTPVMGDWNGDGKTKPGAFINGFWYLDYNGNGVFDGAGVDRLYAFGASGDTPVVGRW